jgi:ABC-type lipoprotein release transport system permease subunit
MEEFGGEYTIEWAEGYSDADFFTEDNHNLCIIGADFGVKPGEIITLLSGDYTRERESVSYKVAAVIGKEIPEDKRDITERIYAPLSENVISLNMGEHFVLDYIEFTLTDNDRSAEFLALLNELRDESRLYSVTAEYNAETDELNNIMRVRDMLVLLFPIALAGAVLIGLTAPGLIIIQSAKEAAILRVLGVTKKRARCMLMFEQIGLCVVGIALAAGGLVLYNSGLFSRSAETLAVCGVLYLLGCVCAAFGASVSVTRRRILELLQVKE